MRIFPPPVAKKRARANSFPRDRPRTLVGGRAAVDLRRKQNLKRNDRKTLSPSPFPLARFGRNDDSARLGPQLRPLVRNRYPRSFARFIARRGSHRTCRAKKRRLSVEQDVISSDRRDANCISSMLLPAVYFICIYTYIDALCDLHRFGSPVYPRQSWIRIQWRGNGRSRFRPSIAISLNESTRTISR